MDLKTKRAYVEATLVKTPIDKYKGAVRKMRIGRKKELQTHSDEIITGLYWRVQGGPQAVVDRSVAVEAITAANEKWGKEQIDLGTNVHKAK